jgi:CheY-like chemotaxis protein
VLTALVVDPSPEARRRIAALLRLGGWQVLEVPDAERALLASAGRGRELDLVVTEVGLPGQTGLALLSRLREAGCRARFLVITTDPTARIRAAAASVGALACLAKPVNPRAIISFLGARTAAPARHLRVVREVEDPHATDLDADLMDRLQEMFVSALPHRLSRIAEGARAGDAMAVASAAQTLGGASGQLGHPEIAAVCEDLAADARRGVVAHGRLVDLQVLSVQATRGAARPGGALRADR